MPRRTRSSMAARKAAKVLPEPVGAATSAWRPDCIAGQACRCASVGDAKLLRNHASTAGWHCCKAMAPYIGFSVGRIKPCATLLVLAEAPDDDADDFDRVGTQHRVGLVLRLEHEPAI